MVYASIWVYEILHDATLCICSVNKLIKLSGSVCLIAVCNLQQLQQKSEPMNHCQFCDNLNPSLSQSERIRLPRHLPEKEYLVPTYYHLSGTMPMPHQRKGLIHLASTEVGRPQQDFLTSSLENCILSA